jgi:pyridoxamine 5'-phosphate oxidase
MDLPEAMALATASAAGDPSVRMVLLRGHDSRGFVLFSNYNSRKGKELAENPKGALLFYWAALRRQVRISGTIEQVSAEESDAYFRTRPRGHQISAWASPQSEVVPDRSGLERGAEQLETQYRDKSIPRPPDWGGLRLRPVSFEFWENRADRLHDRLRSQQEAAGSWILHRLAPCNAVVASEDFGRANREYA